MDLSPARDGPELVSPAVQAPADIPETPRPLPRAPRNGLAMSLERRRLQFYLGMVVADALLLIGSFALANFAYTYSDNYFGSMLAAYLLLPLFQTIAFYNSTYSRDGLTNWKAAAARCLMALLVSALLFNFFAFFAKSNDIFSRVVFVSGLLLAGASMTALRVFIARLVIHNWGPSATNRLLIEAGGPKVRIPHVYRVDASEHGLSPDIEDPIALDRLSRYLRNMDQVIVSCRLIDRVRWAEVLKGSGIHGEVISDYAREIGALGVNHHEDGEITGLIVSVGQLGMRQRAMKRAFDLLVSCTAVLLLSPVMLACALAIKLEDGGPVFFFQRRMGRGNAFFDVFKFRSMSEAKADSAGSRSASKDDDRITRVGRFLRRTSLDELPQLLNVVRGEMSIVGPRPHALGSQAGDKMFWQVDRKYWQRHCLRPGITGLAQIRGLRGATDTERDLARRLQADLEYLNDWSLWRDIGIMLSTLKVLVHDRAF